MATGDVSTRIDREGEVSPDDFPDGFRVLVVDDDHVSLKVMELMLRKCKYKVTLATEAISALDILTEKKEQFDLVIIDVHMPGMDGFELLKHIETEMDLPVIVISADCDYKVVQRGMIHGACDYIIKPPNYANLKTIWRHVFRKGRKNSQVTNIAGQQFVNVEEVSDPKGKKKRNCNEHNEIHETNIEDNTYGSGSTRKQRKANFVWSGEPQQKFVEAVNRLGVAAGPMEILNVMNAIGPVEGLTRQIVSSHLQKFRNGSTRQHFNNEVAFRRNGFSSSLGRVNNSFRFGENQLVPSAIVEPRQVGNITSYSDRETALGVTDPYNLRTDGVIEYNQYLGRAITSSEHGKNQIMASNMLENNTWNSSTDLRIYQGANNPGNMLQGRIANATNNYFPHSITQTCFPVVRSNTIPYNVINDSEQSAANQQTSSIASFPQVEIENGVQEFPALYDPVCMSTDRPISPFLEEEDMEHRMETSKLQCGSSHSGYKETIPVNAPNVDIDSDIDVFIGNNKDFTIDDWVDTIIQVSTFM